jgi:hypothetical protein
MAPPPHILSLMKIAADLRGRGFSWATVAAKVQRNERTCTRWTERYPEVWNQLLREAEDNTLTDTGNTVLGLLRNLAATTQDERLKQDTYKFLANKGVHVRDRQLKHGELVQVTSKWLPLIIYLEGLSDAERKAQLESLLARQILASAAAEPGGGAGASPEQPH